MPFANNNGVRIHYEVVGDGTPLVLHHGFAGCIEVVSSWLVRFVAGTTPARIENYQFVMPGKRRGVAEIVKG